MCYFFFDGDNEWKAKERARERERERKITCTVIEAIDYVRERISKQLRCTC